MTGRLLAGALSGQFPLRSHGVQVPGRRSRLHFQHYVIWTLRGLLGSIGPGWKPSARNARGIYKCSGRDSVLPRLQVNDQLLSYYRKCAGLIRDRLSWWNYFTRISTAMPLHAPAKMARPPSPSFRTFVAPSAAMTPPPLDFLHERVIHLGDRRLRYSRSR
jgi:hypothetical protein